MKQQEIIEKIRQGGQAQLGILYEEYRSEFLRWVGKEYHLSEEDSKDLYQVAILIFYDNVRMGKLDQLLSSIKTYLYGIGKNLAQEHFRKLSRSNPIEKEKWIFENLAEEASYDEETDQRTTSAVKIAMDKLGQPCQRLIELFYYERKSMEEIAGLLNYKNTESAKNQKCKCMARLRKLVEEEISKLKVTISHGV